MDPNGAVQAYLAGPDVFYPDALARGEAKKDILRGHGIVGHFPLDNDLPADVLQDPERAADHIARANEALMLNIVEKARVAVILADMSPYHGPSMDVGTAFEMGFMSALAALHPHVVIIGYTDTTLPFETRVIEQWYGGGTTTDADGILRGPDGLMIETFGQADNLMMTHAVRKARGAIVHSFEEAAAHAALAARDLQPLDHQSS